MANREQKAYPVVLQRLLGKGYQVENFGKPGATLLRRGHRPYFAQPEFRAALQFRPDIAVIHLGINDTDPRNWPNYRDEFIPRLSCTHRFSPHSQPPCAHSRGALDADRRRSSAF